MPLMQYTIVRNQRLIIELRDVAKIIVRNLDGSLSSRLN